MVVDRRTCKTRPTPSRVAPDLPLTVDYFEFDGWRRSTLNQHQLHLPPPFSCSRSLLMNTLPQRAFLQRQLHSAARSQTVWVCTQITRNRCTAGYKLVLQRYKKNTWTCSSSAWPLDATGAMCAATIAALTNARSFKVRTATCI